MNHTSEAWEEEQMSNLGCESVSDLIAEVKRLREEQSAWPLKAHGHRPVKKGDLHTIPVSGHEGEECPHCGEGEKIKLRNDHHYLPYFSILCFKEECMMTTSYYVVRQVDTEPTKHEEVW